ncbi:hypothetical protein E2C01_048205 [Portunus trituberculatus]|uniref:Uncharacterized protein n=1 Tax=Portunus trituberculatus TaxID=210409 RepID=A0A5B7GA38_PORTR|nr:hypothetical protein [Portunus trituberculatus]
MVSPHNVALLLVEVRWESVSTSKPCTHASNLSYSQELAAGVCFWVIVRSLIGLPRRRQCRAIRQPSALSGRAGLAHMKLQYHRALYKPRNPPEALPHYLNGYGVKLLRVNAAVNTRYAGPRKRSGTRPVSDAPDADAD